MVYNLQDRLRHVADRMNEVNTEHVKYVAGDVTLYILACPILISPEEMGIGRDPSMIRVERQDWAVDVSELGDHYPPVEGAKLIRATGEEFKIKPMDVSEPHYVHTISNRDRIIIHSVRTKVATT